MNRQIRRLAAGLIVLYIVLFGFLNFWQIERTEELAAQPSNTRALIRQFDRPRGEILSADGEVLARSLQTFGDTDVSYQRNYPTGDLFAAVVGYHSFGLGSTQIERSQTEVLSGETLTQQLRAIGELVGRTGDQSGQVYLTLRADLQRAARDALGEREGAVVVLEPTTGAVRAMWSWPSYDPNQVVDPDYDAAYEYLVSLQEDARDPLLASAYQQRYMPGSIFKVLTMGAALETNLVDLDTEFPDESEWVPPQTNDPIQNYAGTVCGGDLAEVFYRSCNIPFAKLAIELGPEQFPAQMARWGIGEEVPIDLPGAAASTIGDTTMLSEQLPLLGIRGFGQNTDQMVPLHMAMVASTVANQGVMLEPYVVEATLDQEGDVISRANPTVWKRPISSQTASTLADFMTQVAQIGTASCCIALDDGTSVAAKTGTAQLNGPGEPERSHAWIIAYAPVENPRFAVAVIIEGSNAEISASTGGQLAGPVAKQVLDAALALDPLPVEGNSSDERSEP